jgi:hypothetical protein
VNGHATAGNAWLKKWQTDTRGRSSEMRNRQIGRLQEYMEFLEEAPPRLRKKTDKMLIPGGMVFAADTNLYFDWMSEDYVAKMKRGDLDEKKESEEKSRAVTEDKEGETIAVAEEESERKILEIGISHEKMDPKRSFQFKVGSVKYEHALAFFRKFMTTPKPTNMYTKRTEIFTKSRLPKDEKDKVIPMEEGKSKALAKLKQFSGSDVSDKVLLAYKEWQFKKDNSLQEKDPIPREHQEAYQHWLDHPIPKEKLESFHQYCLRHGSGKLLDIIAYRNPLQGRGAITSEIVSSEGSSDHHWIRARIELPALPEKATVPVEDKKIDSKLKTKSEPETKTKAESAPGSAKDMRLDIFHELINYKWDYLTLLQNRLWVTDWFRNQEQTDNNIQ